MLSFIMDGDTYAQPFSITNGSDGGEEVVGFRLDLTGIGLLYDTLTGGPGFSPGHLFSALGGTDLLTGLVLPVAVSDGATLLSISFTDFGPGETFIWSIDVDSGAVSDTFGNDLIGALAYIDFSDGQTLQAVLVAVPGNSDASQFVVTGNDPGPAVPEPGTLTLLGMGLAGLTALRRRSGSN